MENEKIPKVIVDKIQQRNELDKEMYWELREDGKADESTSYYARGNAYCEAEELVKEEFADLVIGEV